MLIIHKILFIRATAMGPAEQRSAEQQSVNECKMKYEISQNLFDVLLAVSGRTHQIFQCFPKWRRFGDERRKKLVAVEVN